MKFTLLTLLTLFALLGINGSKPRYLEQWSISIGQIVVDFDMYEIPDIYVYLYGYYTPQTALPSRGPWMETRGPTRDDSGVAQYQSNSWGIVWASTYGATLTMTSSGEYPHFYRLRLGVWDEDDISADDYLGYYDIPTESMDSCNNFGWVGKDRSGSDSGPYLLRMSITVKCNFVEAWYYLPHGGGTIVKCGAPGSNSLLCSTKLDDRSSCRWDEFTWMTAYESMAKNWICSPQATICHSTHELWCGIATTDGSNACEVLGCHLNAKSDILLELDNGTNDTNGTNGNLFKSIKMTIIISVVTVLFVFAFLFCGAYVWRSKSR